MELIGVWSTWAGFGCVAPLTTIFNRPAHHARINGIALRVAGVVTLLALGLPLAGSAAPRQQLSGGHVPAAVARLQPIGRLPATRELRLAIGLPLRDPAGLDQFLAEIYDPASPNYRHFLTPEEFTVRFSATEADYAVLKHFALTNGFKITAEHSNRLLLDVVGRTADVERAFRIKLQTYQHPTEGREFFAPDTEPTADAGLPVADIQGLSDYSRPHPNSHRMAPSTGAPNIGSAPDGSSYLGDDFRNAYIPGATSLTGAGQIVGLFQPDGYYDSDIAAYAAAAGNRRANIVIQKVLIDGFNGNPTTGTDSGNGEVSLDIEMAMAMAPGLSRIVVFEGNLTNFIPNNILNTMAASNTIKNLSCSWTWSGGPTTTTDNIFKTMASHGQSFFQASGDTDAFAAGSNNDVDNASQIRAPSSSPYITVVGGSVLTMNGTGASYASETVWNDRTVNPHGGNWGSSGGISTFYPIPSYQQGISMSANQGSTTMRNVPDVALTADNVYVVYNKGSREPFKGTSCAAPLWAGFTALINQQALAAGLPPVGFLNPALYTIGRSANYLAAFNDITRGDNYWTGSQTNYPAVPGYDLCTGWGTPNGTNLINILTVGPIGPPSTPLPPTPPAIVSPPQSQTVAAGANVSFSVIATGTTPFNYQWFFNGQPISSATDYSYSIARVQSSQAGTYTVVVSNSYGSVLSAPATLAIASGSGAFGIIGAPFSYQIVANNNPTWYSASGLPSGLSCDGATGLISGTPARTGTFSVYVQARNIFGSTAAASISLTIADGAITSAPSAQGVIGAPFNYQIVADNSPTGYSVSGLPSGLNWDAGSGLISGTPVQNGTFSVHVQARNFFASASAVISLTIRGGAIISATTAQGVVGVPFSYQIAADNNPTGYSVSGLPSGLNWDAGSGLISGTPAQNGTFPVYVQARNIFASASATISLTISNGVITSATSAQGVIGVPFSYQIVANNNPTGYSASSMPSGLSCDAGSGLISGTPVQNGTFPVYVQARNIFRSVAATISLTISNGAITSAASAQGVIGVPFSYQIIANNNPTGYSASGLPSGLSCDVGSGLISGIPVQNGTFPVSVQARNFFESASATISLTISAGTIGTASQPTLTISQTGAGFLLTWPVTSDGFVLEETQVQPNAWTNSSAQVVVQGNENMATIPTAGTAKFYRLRK